MLVEGLKDTFEGICENFSPIIRWPLLLSLALPSAAIAGAGWVMTDRTQDIQVGTQVSVPVSISDPTLICQEGSYLVSFEHDESGQRVTEQICAANYTEAKMFSLAFSN